MSIGKTKQKRSVRVSLGEVGLVSVLVILLVGLMASYSDTRQTFVSSEVQFSEDSPSGLSIVPASCPSAPSNPDYPHNTCSGSCPNGLNIVTYPSCTCPSGQVQVGTGCVAQEGSGTCTISASPSQIYPPTGVSTLTWDFEDKSYGGSMIPPSNISIDAIPDPDPSTLLTRSGTLAVSPSVTTRYFLNGYYYWFGVQVGSARCSTRVDVLSCPAGTVADDDGDCCTSSQIVAGQCTTLTDLCTNISGMQDRMLYGYHDPAPTDGICVAIDVCTNIAGNQSSMPYGYHDPAPVDGTCVVLDVCTNMPGNQPETPEGFTRTGTTCTAVTNVQISADPSLVRAGDTVDVNWNSKGVNTCTITERGSSVTATWTGTSGTQNDRVINERTIYTITCPGIGADLGKTFTDTAVVNIAPVYEEI